MRPLSELYDFEVADDSPDVRGWEVTAAGGERIGRVIDLLVDTRLMTTRYLLVDRVTAPPPGSSRRVALPVGSAQVDENDRVVQVALTAADAGALEPYTGTIPDGYERTIRSDAPPVQARPAEAREGDVKRITRSAEELRIGRRQVPAGEVRVHKTVETEHVREPVTRTKEDVRVERRPASGTTPNRAEIREDEIRVPITEEELIVEKRPVVKEELVIAKEQKPEPDAVEADLRKERIDVERAGRPEEEKEDHRRRG